MIPLTGVTAHEGRRRLADKRPRSRSAQNRRSDRHSPASAFPTTQKPLAAAVACQPQRSSLVGRAIVSANWTLVCSSDRTIGINAGSARPEIFQRQDYRLPKRRDVLPAPRRKQGRETSPRIARLHKQGSLLSLRCGDLARHPVELGAVTAGTSPRERRRCPPTARGIDAHSGFHAVLLWRMIDAFIVSLHLIRRRIAGPTSGLALAYRATHRRRQSRVERHSMLVLL